MISPVSGKTSTTADVRAEGEGLVGRLEEVGRLEARLDLVRQIAAVGLRRRCRRGSDAAVGHALDLVLAVHDLDILDGRLEHVGSDPVALSLILLSDIISAAPPTASPRLPIVPLPCGVVPVSP